jgi:RHS repeat-associated protein
VGADRLGSIGKFYPYGQEKPSATANGTEKFTGYFRDAETGLDYADQRYHNPGTGRFLTPDPYRAMSTGAADSKTPGSWNKYAYAQGDPINGIDPTGREVCWDDDGEPCYEDPCDDDDFFDSPIDCGGGGGGCEPKPTPPPPPQPECTIELWERPVPFNGSPGNHTYIEVITPNGVVTPFDPTGTAAADLLEGKPAGFPIGSPLIGVVNPVGSGLGSNKPNNPVASNPNLPSNHEIGSPDTSSYACDLISEMETAIISYNSNPVTYTFLGIFGYNSNSFTQTLVSQFGLSFGKPTGWVPGWKKTVPGL